MYHLIILRLQSGTQKDNYTWPCGDTLFSIVVNISHECFCFQTKYTVYSGSTWLAYCIVFQHVSFFRELIWTIKILQYL
jgi:hypothetical protein